MQHLNGYLSRMAYAQLSVCVESLVTTDGQVMRCYAPL